jgi:hypothetical protein
MREAVQERKPGTNDKLQSLLSHDVAEHEDRWAERRILVMITATTMISTTTKCTDLDWAAQLPADDAPSCPQLIHAYGHHEHALGLARLAWLPRCCGEDVERELSLRH